MDPAISANARATLLQNLPKRGVGVEIGVWKGQFSLKILRQARPKHLHLVDPWLAMAGETYQEAWYGPQVTQSTMDEHCQSVRERFAKQINSGIVTVHRAGSTEILRSFAEESIDFVYIDGDHTYDGALADLRDAFRVVKPGGFICGDDYNLGNWWKDDVVRAVHDFLAESSVYVHLLLASQFMIRKRGGAHLEQADEPEGDE